MSLYDYQASLDIRSRGYPFYGILMAAIRGADTDNLEKLKAMWPEVVEEFQARYNAPGGLLPGEKP
jgi:hypothetical protein